MKRAILSTDFLKPLLTSEQFYQNHSWVSWPSRNFEMRDFQLSFSKQFLDLLNCFFVQCRHIAGFKLTKTSQLSYLLYRSLGFQLLGPPFVPLQVLHDRSWARKQNKWKFMVMLLAKFRRDGPRVPLWVSAALAWSLVAFDKGERLHSAVWLREFWTIHRHGFSPPEEFLRGEIIQGKWRDFHRPCAQPRSQALSSLPPERGCHVPCF